MLTSQRKASSSQSTHGNYFNLFIHSTAGPLPKTAPDFWQMVWDQQCLVIVMTTKTMERGRVKCHQYWESSVGEESVYGSFSIKTTAVDSNEDYTVASLEIKNSKVRQLCLLFNIESLLTIDDHLVDWWNQKRVALAVHKLAGLRSSIVSDGYVNIFAARPRETGRNGDCVGWHVGGTSKRTTDRCPLQRRNRKNRFVELLRCLIDSLNRRNHFRNIHNSWYLHIASGGCWNGRHSRHGREDSSSASLFHSDARPICILSSRTHRIRFGSQAS